MKLSEIIGETKGMEEVRSDVEVLERNVTFDSSVPWWLFT